MRLFYFLLPSPLLYIVFRPDWMSHPCFSRSRSICCCLGAALIVVRPESKFTVLAGRHASIFHSPARSIRRWSSKRTLLARERELEVLCPCSLPETSFGKHLFILQRFMACSQKAVYDSSQFLLSVLWIMYRRGCMGFVPQVKWMLYPCARAQFYTLEWLWMNSRHPLKFDRVAWGTKSGVYNKTFKATKKSLKNLDPIWKWKA